MVERLTRVGNGRLDIVQMHHQAGVFVGLAVERDAHAEGMSVHPRIRVPGGAEGRKWAASKLNSL